MWETALLVGIWIIIGATALPLLRHGAWWIRAFEFPRAQITFLGLVAGGTAWFWLDRGDWVIQLSLAVLAAGLLWQLFRILLWLFGLACQFFLFLQIS